MKLNRTISFWVCVLLAVLLTECAKEQVVDALVQTSYGHDRQFHAAGCELVRSVENGALSRFASRDAAIGAGLTPCPVCKPQREVLYSGTPAVPSIDCCQ